eukprot:10699162-Alexandrium_andersonii.AAC.1
MIDHQRTIRAQLARDLWGASHDKRTGLTSTWLCRCLNQQGSRVREIEVGHEVEAREKFDKWADHFFLYDAHG